MLPALAGFTSGLSDSLRAGGPDKVEMAQGAPPTPISLSAGLTAVKKSQWG